MGLGTWPTSVSPVLRAQRGRGSFVAIRVGYGSGRHVCVTGPEMDLWEDAGHRGGAPTVRWAASEQEAGAHPASWCLQSWSLRQPLLRQPGPGCGEAHRKCWQGPDHTGRRDTRVLSRRPCICLRRVGVRLSDHGAISAQRALSCLPLQMRLDSL